MCMVNRWRTHSDSRDTIDCQVYAFVYTPAANKDCIFFGCVQYIRKQTALWRTRIPCWIILFCTTTDNETTKAAKIPSSRRTASFHFLSFFSFSLRFTCRVCRVFCCRESLSSSSCQICVSRKHFDWFAYGRDLTTICVIHARRHRYFCRP